VGVINQVIVDVIVAILNYNLYIILIVKKYEAVKFR
jgi:hypothetical protein